MKLLKRILIILVVLVAVLVVVSQFLPGRYHIERSVVVAAKADSIHPWVNNLKKWPEWSPWTAVKDPSIVYSYEGPEEGVGAVSKWDSKKWGDGIMKVTESDPAKGVKFDLGFNKGKHVCSAAVLFSTAGDDTKVTWSMEGTVSRNPLDRFFSLMMEKFVAPDFEEGLGNLKKKAEGK